MADPYLELTAERGARFCFACPSGFYSLCDFFFFFTEYKEGAGAPRPSARSATGLYSELNTVLSYERRVTVTLKFAKKHIAKHDQSFQLILAQNFSLKLLWNHKTINTYKPCSIVSIRAKHASDFITQINSDKQDGIVEDLTLFQARKQVSLNQFLKREFGVNFPPVSFRTSLCCLTLAGFN